MSVSITYEIRSDAEILNAPIIKKVTYSNGAEVSSVNADPVEVKFTNPAILDEYFLAYKSYLTDYLSYFSNFEEASTKEAKDLHISVYAVSYYFRDLVEMANPTLENSALLAEDEEL